MALANSSWHCTSSLLGAWRSPRKGAGEGQVGGRWEPWASMVAQLVKNPPAMPEGGRQRFDPRVRKILWRRARQPTPVFLPGESHGQGSLAGYSSWGGKEAFATGALSADYLNRPSSRS